MYRLRCGGHQCLLKPPPLRFFNRRRRLRLHLFVDYLHYVYGYKYIILYYMCAHIYDHSVFFQERVCASVGWWRGRVIVLPHAIIYVYACAPVFLHVSIYIYIIFLYTLPVVDLAAVAVQFARRQRTVAA